MEGYMKSADDPEQLLYQSRVSLNIYPGQHPHCEANETSIDATSIAALPISQFISIGICGTETWHLYHFTEIGTYFERQMDFCDPANSKNRLSPRCVNKLYGFAPMKLRQIIDRIYVRHNTLAKHISMFKASSNPKGYVMSVNAIINAIQNDDATALLDAYANYEARGEIREMKLLPLVVKRHMAGLTEPIYAQEVDPELGLTIHGLISLIRKSNDSCKRVIIERLSITVDFFMKNV